MPVDAQREVQWKADEDYQLVGRASVSVARTLHVCWSAFTFTDPLLDAVEGAEECSLVLA